MVTTPDEPDAPTRRDAIRETAAFALTGNPTGRIRQATLFLALGICLLGARFDWLFTVVGIVALLLLVMRDE